ncbi:DUF4238 domain-containing protein [Pseudomonas reactans]|uniref:DUF4238 domain-containing protein n=1 Tax=Pseudomonas reactans TaxID=117680 RepID=UPI00159FEDCA|nr:DUF4238 domain-containing protein [Pseudomonas reactans]NWF17156.1 DUF4238 domain-containing protein [Pseudomonas reactans]
MSTQYRHNHYVPEWYQKRFFPSATDTRKFYYLDLHPETVKVESGHSYKRADVMYWGPQKCFAERDLYTTKFADFESTEIEEKFFGEIDKKGKRAVEYFSEFSHPSVDRNAFMDLMNYISVQKLRTPKGLEYLKSKTNTLEKNELLFRLQQFRNVFCTMWAECTWQLADCLDTETKFIISDHPVTVYNKGFFPRSALASKYGDPEIWNSGTHTYFPLSETRILILSNLSWVRQPYGNPLANRPNPNLFRQTIFNFTSIQTHRNLDELEVLKINHITKARARRYVAARQRDWLYPEKHFSYKSWSDFGDEYLFMPDPRSVGFATQTIIGYENGRSQVFDEYGRRPGQTGFTRDVAPSDEWDSFQAFQGEYARRFGPRRRGRCMEFTNLTNEEDSADFHRYHLSLEQNYSKKKRKRTR